MYDTKYIRDWNSYRNLYLDNNNYKRQIMTDLLLLPLLFFICQHMDNRQTTDLEFSACFNAIFPRGQETLEVKCILQKMP